MSHNLKKISYKDIDTLILFGGSFLMACLLDEILKGKFGFRIVLFTAPRHLDSVIDERGTTLRVFLKNRKVEFVETDDINSHPQLGSTVTKNSLGFALGAAWYFEKKTVQLFAPGYLLDVMGVDLPRYRGGAHYTWQILHGNRQGAVNLQVVLGGKEAFHAGPILKSMRYRLPQTVSEPIDYFTFCMSKETQFLFSFLSDVKQRKSFTLREIDERRSAWYPFLSTVHHGLINWSWRGKDIALFINAFGDPYKGAGTFLGGKRFFLKGCAVLKPEESYHPFTSGIVIRNNKEGLFVASNEALLRIARILNEKGDDVRAEILPGSRLFTPSSALDAAMGFNAVYGASGLKK